MSPPRFRCATLIRSEPGMTYIKDLIHNLKMSGPKSNVCVQGSFTKLKVRLSGKAGTDRRRPLVSPSRISSCKFQVIWPSR